MFVSSCFEGLETERNTLATHAFSALRAQCEALGTTFNDVDLRWGVTAEESLSHQAMGHCLEAIDCCNVFLGIIKDRYGTLLGDTLTDFQELPLATRENWPWLKECLDYSYTEIEMEYGVFSRPEAAKYALFYIDEHSSPTDQGIEAQQIRRLIDRVNSCRTGVVSTFASPEELAEKVRQDLARLIEVEFPPPESLDEVERQRHRQQALVESHSQVHVGRDATRRKLFRSLQNAKRPLLITGESGLGKTALLACLVKEWRDGRLDLSGWRTKPRWKLLSKDKLLPVECVYRLLPQDSDTPLSALVSSLLLELKTLYQLPLTVPDDRGTQLMVFSEWLKRLPSDRRTLFIIDGLDNVIESAKDLDWIPAVLPRHIRFILASARLDVSQWMQKRKCPVLSLKPLSSKHRLKLVKDYLWTCYARKIDPEPLKALVNQSESGNPLLLKVVMEELHQLRTSPISQSDREEWKNLSDESKAQLRTRRLVEAIRNCVRSGKGIEGAFSALLTRLESDFSRSLVSETFAFLHISRRGLSAYEIRELAGHGGLLLDRIWQPLYHAIRPWLLEQDGRLQVLSGELKSAIRKRYLPDADDIGRQRRKLVDGFRFRQVSARLVEELPWQLARLRAWRELADVLSSPNFLKEAACSSHVDLKQYWSLVSANTDRTALEVCERIILDPQGNEDLFAPLAQLAGQFDIVSPAHVLTQLWQQSASQNGQHTDFLDALLFEGNLYLKCGQIVEALDVLQRHFEVARRQKGQEATQAAGLGRQAMALLQIGRYESAWDVLKEVEMLQKLLGEYDGLAETIGLQGEVLNQCGRHEEALEFFEAQERICRRYLRPDGALIAFGNQAAMLMKLNRRREALVRFREEETIARRLGDFRSLCRCLLIQAQIHWQFEDTGDYHAAIGKLDECEQICQDTRPRNQDLLAATLDQRSQLYDRLGPEWQERAASLRRQAKQLTRTL